MTSSPVPPFVVSLSWSTRSRGISVTACASLTIVSGHFRGDDLVKVAYTIEAYAEPFLRSGQLVRVLEDWSPTVQGLFLYYPGRRQVPAALRALIDLIRAARSNPVKGSLPNPFAEH
jgi:DNA-binding transcriptional LysR family regulator